jgi:DNA-binding IclR family transcriptional regulator
MVVKAFRLIEVLAGDDGGKSLAKLAQAANLTKPTAHRVLNVLSDMGYVDRVGPGVYRLGHRLLRIVLGRENERLIAAAKPVVSRLHELTGETVNFGVVQHGWVVYLVVIECTQPLRRVASPNESHPFYCTAIGRAIVAHYLPEQRERLLAGAKLERRTPHTVTRLDELKKILEKTRASGIAVEEGETDVGVTCMAAPVFDAGRVIAGLSVSVPTARLDASDRQELYRIVRDAAARLTDILGRKERVIT